MSMLRNGKGTMAAWPKTINDKNDARVNLCQIKLYLKHMQLVEQRIAAVLLLCEPHRDFQHFCFWLQMHLLTITSCSL